VLDHFEKRRAKEERKAEQQANRMRKRGKAVRILRKKRQDSVDNYESRCILLV